MAIQVKHSEIKAGEFYGIQTWGGASSGLWQIAKVISVGKNFVTYEHKTGPTMTSKKRCKIEDVFDAKSCAIESASNRPEYASSYQQWL